MTTEQPFAVVIAGGGVAALEAALALRDIAGDRVALTLVAPDADFVYRPMTVGEPFANPPAQRVALSEVAAELGARLVVDSFGWVAPKERVAHTGAGTELPYDALVLALGARVHSAFAHATTIDDRRMDELLHGIVQDVEEGYLHSLAFVAPARMPWPLPLYELALMTARRAYDMNATLQITVVTPEDSPLAMFGAAASDELARLMSEAGIEVIASATAGVPDAGHVVVSPGTRTLEVDRVLAMPELFGPAVRGLPAGEHGFIPVDALCQVRGVARVFAAGDATDAPVKYGGVAAAQADTVAQAVAALAGLPVTPEPVRSVIHGVLLTGGAPRYLTAHLTGGEGFSAQVTDAPVDAPATKIVAQYLTPFLERFERRDAV